MVTSWDGEEWYRFKGLSLCSSFDIWYRDLHSGSELLIQPEKLDQAVTTTVSSASNEANWWYQSHSLVLSAVSGWRDLQPRPSCIVGFVGKDSLNYLWYLIVLPCLHLVNHSTFWILRCSGNQNWLKHYLSLCQRSCGQLTSVKCICVPGVKEGK